MPKNDYTDPELTFPRLQARIQRLDGESYWLQVWLRKEPGEVRRELMKRKHGGFWLDAHEHLKAFSEEHDAWVNEDDIDVE